ncbi:MAG: class I SAM-dependent methyltransferase [Verrucomicrobiota bacterium]
MKLHRPLAAAAAVILKNVFREHKVLDHELAAAFEANPKWGKRDRGFIAETVFEIARWRRALEFVAGSGQIRALCAAQWRRMGVPLADWWEHPGVSEDEMARREFELDDQPRAVRESIPDWLDETGAAELGGDWDKELAALNQRAPVFLRANTLRGFRERALAWLAAHEVVATEVPGLPDAVVLAQGSILPKAMRVDGRVEIQDAGSQRIAPMLEAKPGEFVIDACSGAGGKTLHLAALMENEGRIHALDVNAAKLEQLKSRAKRAGVTMIRTAPILGDTVAGFAGKADALLIDAPCSGLGTLRRQPDLKWRLKPGELDRLRAVQAELLGSYPAMLKPGGRLVYATCSLLRSENRKQVDALLSRGGFTLEEEITVSPAKDGCDGFYAARLRKD